MFRSFFLDRRWLHWSLAGSIIILVVTWYKVQLDVRINEWFGEFGDTIQEALTVPGSVDLSTFLGLCLTFTQIAAIYVAVAVVLEFFIRHYVFRWRTAMNNYYMDRWPRLRHIEGAAQRVQEDTMRFARIMEGLGVSFMRAIMTLFAFLPLLWGLSQHVTELPWIGPVDHALPRAGQCCSRSWESSCRDSSSTSRRWRPPTARNSSSARTTTSARTRPG